MIALGAELRDRVTTVRGLYWARLIHQHKVPPRGKLECKFSEITRCSFCLLCLVGQILNKTDEGRSCVLHRFVRMQAVTAFYSGPL